MSKSFVLGVDDGHATVNVVGEGGLSVTVNSRVRNGASDSLIIGREPDIADGATITVNGSSFSCGPTVNTSYMDTRIDDFPGSDQNIALIAYGVASYFKGDIPDHPINICTGLPMSVYYPNLAEMARNDELINHKNKAIKEKEIIVTVGKSSKQIKFGDVITRPECMMAIYDEMIAESPKQGVDRYIARADSSKLKDKTTCYLDIGGRTTDLVFFDGDALIGQCSGSSEVGVLTTVDKVRDSLKLTYGELTSKRLDELMKFYMQNRNNSDAVFKFQNKEIKVVPVVTAILEQEILKIQNFISTKINSRKDQIDMFRIFGGGQYLFQPLLGAALADYPIEWSDKPELVNARSFYKFMRYGR